jgi:large subunit ribosomal protein L4
MALSSKLQENELTVVDRLELERIKTKAFAEVIRALDKNNVLLVTDAADEKLILSSRNLPGVKVIKVEGLNVYDILKCKDVILLEPAVKAIEGRLSA